MKLLLFSLMVVFITIAGCDRGVERYEAGEKPQSTAVAKTSPSPATSSIRPVRPIQEAIEGTIEVAPALAGRIPDNAVLFLIARSAATGPPLAVKRIPVPQFPFHFSIGPDDRMIQAMPFKGPIRLSARIDADGNATTRSPGDLQAVSDIPHDPGARGVTLLINEEI